MGIWNLLGKLITPSIPGATRTPEEQKSVDLRTSRLALYQFDSCPFCIRVNRVIKQLNLDIPRRNIHQSSEYAAELLREGGKKQVPCLRIDHGENPAEWLYESRDIIQYLKEEFSSESSA